MRVRKEALLMASPNQFNEGPAASDPAALPKGGNEAVVLEAVAQAIARLRYGAIGLTVHDGRVVQLDVTERQRFT